MSFNFAGIVECCSVQCAQHEFFMETKIQKKCGHLSKTFEIMKSVFKGLFFMQ
jgi:hypothetical protein